MVTETPPSVLLCVSTETTTSLCTQHEYQKDKTTEELLLLGGTLTDAHALTQIFVFEFSRRAAESSAAESSTSGRRVPGA